MNSPVRKTLGVLAVAVSTVTMLSAPGEAAEKASEAKTKCAGTLHATPGQWTEDRGCAWGTPPGEPSRVGFSWGLPAPASNQQACVEAKADAGALRTPAGCGSGGSAVLPAPGNSIGAFQVRATSMLPFSIALVRWGDTLTS